MVEFSRLRASRAIFRTETVTFDCMSGGDSHIEISVIPILGHPCIHVSTAMVPEPGNDLWLFCQCKGGHIKANVKWQRRWGYDWYQLLGLSILNIPAIFSFF